MSTPKPSKAASKSPAKTVSLHDRESDCLQGLMPAVADKTPAWTWYYDLGPELLKSIDPVPLIINQLTEIQSILPQRQSLFTIFAELYNNAIEHGVLGLDSELKQSPEGFAEYFDLRESRIEALLNGWVTIRVVKYTHENQDAWLHITLEDSGDGFDYEAYLEGIADHEKPSGRGIYIVQNLCDRIRYSQGGRRVDVIYNLKK